MIETVHNKEHSKSATGIVDILTRLQRRGRTLTLATGMAWTISGSFVLLIVLIAALGWWGGSSLRVAGWSTVGLGTTIILIWKVLLPLRRLASLDSVARRIGRVQPEKLSDLLSACQLASSEKTQVFSSSLLERYFDNAYHTLDAIPSRRVFPTGPLLPPLLALAITVAATSGVNAAIPGVLETGLRTLWREPHVPADIATTVVSRSPVLGDLTATLRYPDYLKREPRKLDSVSGGLMAPVGTTVVLEGKSLIENADRGYIRIPNGDKIPLNVEKSSRVAGRFVVSEPGAFLLSLGTQSKTFEGPERNIEVENDAPPSIRLLRPTNEVEIDSNGELTIEFDAQDDHGLDRVDLVLRAGDKTEIRKTIMRAGDRVQHVRSSYQWSPQSLNFSGESKIEMELEAFDNDTIRGPKPGRASGLVVRIMTRASRHQDVLEEQGRTLDALVDLLAARLESQTPTGTRKIEEAKEHFSVLRGQTEDLLGRAARLIYKLKKDPLTNRVVTEVFIQIREDLSNQLLHESRLHREPIAGYRKRQGVDKVTVRILEAAIISVDDIILDQQFGNLIDEGSRLDMERKKLAELINRYAETGSEPARRAVMDIIDQLDQAVRKLQRDLERVRGEVADTYVNSSALNTIDLIGSLVHLKKLLASGDLKKATAFAKNLEQEIARLMASLESGQMAFRTDRFGEGEKFVGDLLDRLMSIESDQLQLRRQTTASLRWYRERLREVMRKRIDPLVKKQTDRVAKMTQHLDTLKKSGAISDSQLLAHLVAATDELGFALRQGDLDEAKQTADDISQNIKDFGAKLNAPLPDKLTSLMANVDKISVELEEAFPKPSHLLSDREKRRTRLQSIKQRHLSAKTRTLRTWIKKQGDDTKFLALRALESLSKVADHMAEGVEHLEARNAREALEAQTGALNELASLREDLRRGNEAAPLESRPIVLRGEVPIPEPGDFEVPKEYRDDILEAMRGDLPDNYRDAITRYYETLVR